jgi:hypothetical protein
MSQFNDSEDPRRRLLLQALATGLLAGALPDNNTANAGLFGDRPAPLPPGRSIYKLEGRVLVNGALATIDTQIGATDVVETGSDGSIVFVVGKDAMLMRNNSKLVLTPESGKKTIVESVVGNMRLLAGQLLTVFAKRRHTIETPTVVIGVRGTGVYLEANPQETYLCTCYGVVDLTAATDKTSRETIEATHHDKPRYIAAKGNTGKRIRPAPMKNHTDQELMLIEEIVGRTPPFVFPMDDYSAPRREY